MNKYLGLYNTHLEFNNGASLEAPYVAICKDENHVHYATEDAVIDYENIPLTFEILGEDNYTEGDTYCISLEYDGETDDWVIDDIEYKINDGEWTFGTFGETTIDNLVPGNLVQFRSSIHPYTHRENSSNYFVNYFSCNTKFNLFGNIESLNGYDGSYQGLDAYQYYRLFVNCRVVSAKNLILGRSDTDLTPHCYDSLFMNATLIEPPKLPMTNLNEYCYRSMFFGCADLILPDDFTLPATTLQTCCYSTMFSWCTRLNTLPSNLLPATNLAKWCYSEMFLNCTSLTTIPNDLLPATTLSLSCYYSMFKRCTALTGAPELPATTLVNGCYGTMFYKCSNLNYIKAMFTTTPSTEYTNAWVHGVSSTGTFIKNSTATWDVTGDNGIPEGWTVQTA